VSRQWAVNTARHHLFTYSWQSRDGTTGRVLGPASTNFNDYLGTVAADDADAVIYEPSLYELAELDRDRYTILAVDLRVEGRTTATVYAMDRLEHPEAPTAPPRPRPGPSRTASTEDIDA
jgi:hypothetical protein